eukprot:TRINITY_DN9968_c0_g1_i3.p1 TRINITY_DN9968_c0_g1~~TRINITY_DN9968_c0_g1_i3.p1  ORF type:complete len:185 (+),score=14.11 TRINITY_DN9968_c0_g1_i3:284-838(+)
MMTLPSNATQFIILDWSYNSHHPLHIQRSRLRLNAYLLSSNKMIQVTFKKIGAESLFNETKSNLLSHLITKSASSSVESSQKTAGVSDAFSLRPQAPSSSAFHPFFSIFPLQSCTSPNCGAFRGVVRLECLSCCLSSSLDFDLGFVVAMSALVDHLDLSLGLTADAAAYQCKKLLETSYIQAGV